MIVINITSNDDMVCPGGYCHLPKMIVLSFGVLGSHQFGGIESVEPRGPGTRQDAGHGPFDSPLKKILPGMAMSIASDSLQESWRT